MICIPCISNNISDINNKFNYYLPISIGISIFFMFLYGGIYFSNKIKKKNYYINQQCYFNNIKIINIFTKFDFSYINIFLLSIYILYNKLIFVIYFYKLIDLYFINNKYKKNIICYYLNNLLIFPITYFLSDLSLIRVISSIGIIFTQITIK